MIEFGGVKIWWLGHDSYRIKDDKTIYIDPYKISKAEPADLILITHEHFDHFSVEDIMKIVKPDTVVVGIQACRPGMGDIKVKEIKTVRPGDRIEAYGVAVEAVQAYNTNKFREPGVVFHPKVDGKVGYVLVVRGVRVYHAGDTDHIPEMRNIKADVALLPVSGTYVMTAEEAANAANDIKPKLAIPMHYGAIVGSEKDAEQFRKLAKCEVAILRKES